MDEQVTNYTIIDKTNEISFIKRLLLILFFFLIVYQLKSENDSISTDNSFSIDIDYMDFYRYLVNNNNIKVYDIDVINFECVETLVDSVVLTNDTEQEFIDILENKYIIELNDLYINEFIIDGGWIEFNFNYKGWKKIITVHHCYIEILGQLISVINKYIDKQYFCYYTFDNNKKYLDYNCIISDQKKMKEYYFGK